MLSEAVYGLPELHREELRGAHLASGVGCNATATNLALFPLAREGLIQEARVECRVGSSEAGSSASEGSHHPFRSRALRIVEPFRHRHLAEVAQEMEMAEDSLSMTVTAVEMVRGVQMMARVTFRETLREADLWKLYRKAFRGQPFLGLCPARPKHLRFPDPRLVMGSNQVLVGFALEQGGRTGIVVSAIDNLMKGASGTAVQAANLMMGLDETLGLQMLPVYPA
jgi:N-acetyl-gamma-glutamyl-phosphate/LysW-gamma-L-alpha-aminoadipyl-6-phosphate reductase